MQKPNLRKWLIYAGVATGAGLLLGGCVTPQAIQAAAEENLAIYAVKAEYKPIACVGQDTDSDGWVTCSAIDRKGDDISLLCAYTVANTGCKPKPTSLTPVNQ